MYFALALQQGHIDLLKTHLLCDNSEIVLMNGRKTVLLIDSMHDYNIAWLYACWPQGQTLCYDLLYSE